jgi:hypothetical protein
MTYEQIFDTSGASLMFHTSKAIRRCLPGLALACIAVALSACGGGKDSEDVASDASRDTPAITAQGFPNFAMAVGFFDTTKDHQVRAIRNDLGGGQLAGMVQFVQSHSVNPSGNAANNLPTLVSSRDALLLFTPQNSPTGKLSVEVQAHGVTKHNLPMAAPDELPATDLVGSFDRPDVAYTKRAWSVVLPWTAVQPGMSLVFRDQAGLSGTLAAGKIEMGAPAELVVWGIRVGMLTNTPVDPGPQPMLSDPAAAATDYFQTIPVARLVAAGYEDLTLDRVMMADGRILTGASPGEADVHHGDMRENVGKSQVSIGINLANYGIASSVNGDQGVDRTTPQIVYHHSAGNYANGRKVHGLSGGGAIATLYGSTGNEWSHEFGHNFGMGHYPGANGTDYFWTAHHADSGWGYIGHRKRMRSNLAMTSPERGGLYVNGVANPQSFAGQYSYLADAMSGGWVQTEAALSRYTHYTGYTAKRIQDSVNRAWFDPSSPTGYSRWDAAAGKVVNDTPKDRARPTRFGVPVFTLLGAYDPNNGTAVMYPPARGNYGMVFDKLPPPDAAWPIACWVDVKFANASRSIALHGDRVWSGASNKFHINIAQADKPQQASLLCRRDASTITRLAQVAFPQGLPDMPAAVVVGESAGYDALAAKELPQLDAALQALRGDDQPVPDRTLQLWLDSWSERRDQLSAAASEVLLRIARTRDKALSLDRWMTQNAAGLDAGTPATVETWRTKLANSGLVAGGSYADRFGLVRGHSEGCLALAGKEAATARLVMVAKASCARVPEQLWLQDRRGALRSAALPGHCVSLVDYSLTLAPCNRESGAQFFRYADSVISPTSRPDLALDLNRNSGEVTGYRVHGRSNQQWRELKRDPSSLLAYLSTENAQRLLKLEATK